MVILAELCSQTGLEICNAGQCDERKDMLDNSEGSG